jgi:hypothetical protein
MLRMPSGSPGAPEHMCVLHVEHAKLLGRLSQESSARLAICVAQAQRQLLEVWQLRRKRSNTIRFPQGLLHQQPQARKVLHACSVRESHRCNVGHITSLTPPVMVPADRAACEKPPPPAIAAVRCSYGATS